MVRRDQQFTASNPCPICGGHQRLLRHHGVRCFGFEHDDPHYVTCTRISSRHDAANGWTHRVSGDCKCGTVHGTATDRTVPRLPTPGVTDNPSDVAMDILCAVEAVEGTVAETYLRSRGVAGPFPASLYVVPSFPWGRERGLPALAAGVTRWPDNILVGAHVTFLHESGERKADIDPARKMYGSVSGGVVRLGEVGSWLGIAEGIETSLAFQQLYRVPTWAALSAGNLPKLVLPPLPLASEIWIGADCDDDGVGLAKARQAAETWRNEGRLVLVIPAPEGMDFADYWIAVNGGTHVNALATEPTGSIRCR